MIGALLISLLLLVGALFMLVAALGLVRLPDLLMRMHSATKAGSLGAGCILAGAALRSGDAAAITRALLVVLLVFLTAPVAMHMIARAAHIAGGGRWSSDAATWPGRSSSSRRDRPDPSGSEGAKRGPPGP